jgi:endonuclease/exonuclease/phosphatase family metal-dependent hydrolase
LPSAAETSRSADPQLSGPLKVLCWNLFHGRDAPPDPNLHTLRSRLLKTTEDNGRHLQVNRSLLEEFAEVIGSADWSLCLLQEAPPAWAGRLAERSGAAGLCSLTSRNQLAPLTRRLARWNPDLIASWEGGANLALVRPPWRIVEGSQRSLLLNPLRVRGLRERRRMSFLRLASEAGSRQVCVSNLHATHYSQRLAEGELRSAATRSVAWAGRDPLVFGGDLNLRPAASSVFSELERQLGLAGTTGPDAVDHILVRGLVIREPPHRWPPERREVEVPWQSGRRRIRLSDHAPVEAAYALPAPDG